MATVNLNNLSKLRHKYLPVLLNYQNAADSAVLKTRSFHTNTTFAIPIKDNLFRTAKKSATYYRFYSIKAAGDETVSDEEYRNEHNITIIGDDIPSPYTDIEKSDFPTYIKDFLKSEGFVKPTVIQSQGWPIALNGQNFVGIAQTGTGKTLAYLLPAVVHIKEKEAQRGLGPRVLVLAPTRELARQIEQVAVKFRKLNIRCACIYGGASRLRQLEQLQAGVDIVIATPGRLNDFITSKSTSLSRCKYIVLDEADRMLDMGFEPQIRQALEGIPLERQILMFSATWPKEIQQLAREYLGEFVQVNVGSVELSANHNIKQHIHFCENGDASKNQILNSIMQDLSAEGLGKVLVFANTKKRVDYLTSMLRHNGFYALGIHGDKSQMQRDTIIYKFKKGSVNILIATEVAARGLDVDGITHVINYDFPPVCEDYIHRIGRTGRSQNKGVSHTLLTSEDARQAGSLVSILKEANQEVPEELVQLWRDYKNNKIREPTRKFKPNNRNNWNPNRRWNRYSNY